MVSDPNGPQRLSEEILADGRRESAAIIQSARAQAQSLLTEARAEADKVRKEQLTQVRTEAERRAELIRATVPVEAERLRAARVEKLLESLRQEAASRLSARDGLGYGETLVALAVEALSQMEGEAFAVELTGDDCDHFGSKLMAEIGRKTGRPLNVTLSRQRALRGGGLVVRDHEGRQLWDNRFEEKLERLWPELRRQIAVQTGLVRGSGSAGGAG